MSTGTLSPVARQEFFDNDGLPLAGGLLYTSASGQAFLAAPLAVYHDADLMTPWTNPLVLDADGRATFYLSATSYRFALHDADDVLMYTVDPVQSTAVSSDGEAPTFFAFNGDPTSPITDVAYPTGASYDKCHAGSSWLRIDSADIAAGTYVLEAMLLATGGTVTVAMVNLSDGSPDTPIATCASTSATGELVTSTSLSFAAPGATKTYAIKVKVSAGSGEVWGVRLVRS